MSDLVGTLEYLHSVGVAHRDIKPENVMFESKVGKQGAHAFVERAASRALKFEWYYCVTKSNCRRKCCTCSTPFLAQRTGREHLCSTPMCPSINLKSDSSAMYLIDFGFAASGVVGQSLTTACGTPQYAAPEILNAMPHGVEVL